MRRLAFGISVAVAVLCTSALVSYVILNHVYGKGYTAISTRTIIIENAGQQVTIESTTFVVENAEYQAGENTYRLYFYAPAAVDNAGNSAPEYSPAPASAPLAGEYLGKSSVDVPSAAYEQAQETGNPVTVSDITTTETEPLNALPIAASIGIVMSIVVFGVWVGYRRMWGDATSTLLEHGLQDMTVRDVELVGQIMDLKEFTIPQLMKETRASKLKVWRTVQKLIEQGLVQQTDQTKSAANGMGGRGKPSNVYKYVGKPETK